MHKLINVYMNETEVVAGCTNSPTLMSQLHYSSTFVVSTPVQTRFVLFREYSS